MEHGSLLRSYGIKLYRQFLFDNKLLILLIDVCLYIQYIQIGFIVWSLQMQPRLSFHRLYSAIFLPLVGSRKQEIASSSEDLSWQGRQRGQGSLRPLYLANDITGNIIGLEGFQFLYNSVQNLIDLDNRADALKINLTVQGLLNIIPRWLWG